MRYLAKTLETVFDRIGRHPEKGVIPMALATPASQFSDPTSPIFTVSYDEDYALVERHWWRRRLFSRFLSLFRDRPLGEGWRW